MHTKPKLPVFSLMKTSLLMVRRLMAKGLAPAPVLAGIGSQCCARLNTDLHRQST